jgi:carboxypeptidase PM20D1
VTKRRILILIVSAFLLLVGIMVVRALRFEPVQPVIQRVPQVGIHAGAAERLARSIRIPTISHDDPASVAPQAFQGLHAYLEAAFPLVHSQLQREKVGTHSLLYTWQGSDSSLKPILLMGHLDVVPIEPGTEAKWQEEPFSGRIANGFIWGRGAIDNKLSVLGTLEAVEMLLREGFRPARGVYLAYGHDEEVGGQGGAREIAALLKRRGVELEMVLDEGGIIGEGLLQGISRPVALVGIAEKGFASIELSTRSQGGHSSIPPRQSTIGILGSAIARLEKKQMPARLEQPTEQLFERIGPRFPFAQRAIFANLWVTHPLVIRKLEDSPTTNAMVRTTTAATIFQAGSKENVLPSRARAVVNFRILPGDSVAGVVQHVRRVVDDPRVDARLIGFSAEPSEVSSTDSESFRTLERVIQSMAPEATVAPYLVVVLTDARYYSQLSRNVFRFLPVQLTARDLERMHGTNERIAVRDYERAIGFYRHLILVAAEAESIRG